MRNDPKERALETCIQNMQAGASIDQALLSYPHWSEELRPLLEAAQAAQDLSRTIQVPELAQARSRADFFLAAHSQQARSLNHSRPPTWRLSLASFAIIVVILVASISSLVASARSLPGEPLYQIKRVSEQARLIITINPAQRMMLQQSFDRQRILEIQELQQRSRSADIIFSEGLESITPDAWQVGPFRVLVLSETQVIGQIKTGFHIIVEGKIQPDGSILAHSIQAREYELYGKIQNMSSEKWLVDGLSIYLSSETIIQGTAKPGMQVHIKALMDLKGSFSARLIEVIEPEKKITSPTPSIQSRDATINAPIEKIQPTQLPGGQQEIDPSPTPPTSGKQTPLPDETQPDNTDTLDPHGDSPSSVQPHGESEKSEKDTPSSKSDPSKSAEPHQFDSGEQPGSE